VHALFVEARDTVYPTPELRARAAGTYRQRLLDLARPVAADPDAPARQLSARLERFIGDLFVFVTEPGVAPTNNLAERSLRPLVTRRKISGGSRSTAGTEATMALASLFGDLAPSGSEPVQRVPRSPHLGLNPLKSEQLHGLSSVDGSSAPTSERSGEGWTTSLRL